MEPDYEIEITKNGFVPIGSNVPIYLTSAPKFYDFTTIASYLDSLETE